MVPLTEKTRKLFARLSTPEYMFSESGDVLTMYFDLYTLLDWLFHTTATHSQQFSTG